MIKYHLIKNLITEKGYRQKFVAKKIGLTESAFSAILSGKRKCGLEAYARLCMFLEVPFDYFVVLDDSNKEPAA